MDFKFSGLSGRAGAAGDGKEFSGAAAKRSDFDVHCVTRLERAGQSLGRGRAVTDVNEALVRGSQMRKFRAGLAEKVTRRMCPLADLLRGRMCCSRLSTTAEPLAAEHGGPAASNRALSTRMGRAWKWVSAGMSFGGPAGRRPLGFWERNGYHAYGDPWKISGTLEVERLSSKKDAHSNVWGQGRSFRS